MISGNCGSGAVFFSGCNLRCVFCQNYDISVSQKGEPQNAGQLAELFLSLQTQGAHTINLVTPAPHVPALLQAIPLARARGLAIPIVYNTNAYETMESIRSLDGLIDIYLPDLKYVSSSLSQRFSDAGDYFDYAAPAILEMFHQVGTLALDENQIAARGLLVRHLVLPNSLADTRRVLDFLAANLPLDTQISLMRQYTPVSPSLPPPLDRRLTEREYTRAVQYAETLGFTRLLLQEAGAASDAFIPTFYFSLSHNAAKD